MASFNSSGWPQTQDFLDQMRRIQVVAGQGLHLEGHRRLLAEGWYLKRDWRAFTSDAQLSDDGKALGGVGLFVRRHINAVPLQAFTATHEPIPGRSVVMMIQYGIRGGLIVGSTYLQQGPRLSG
eukprot:921469-Pyramimonas_sp.AAC.1